MILKVEAIKKVSEYVAQLRRVGKGHGKFSFMYYTMTVRNEV